MRARLMWIGGLCLLAMAFAACGGDDFEGTEIRMLDNLFAPEVVEVGVGEEVRFVNDGQVPHNAIENDGVFNSLVAAEANQDPGEAWTIILEEPGLYDYYCSLHATQNAAGEWEGMTGSLVVGGAADVAEVSAAASEAPAAWTEVTRRVPDDHATIQNAVDAADPGDLVLIDPGVYREAVSVTTPGLTIRGADRNEVILDGEFTRENGIFVTADGVAIENMTARNYTVNGFFWDGVTGYRGSYLTAVDDWVYGIYAFDSVDGLFEHSYASGSWDSGFYIGQCDPCNAVITDVLSEFNGLGYSGTNSSGNIYVVNSEWRYNVAGVAPNTLDSELLPPVNNVVVAGNFIHHNGEDERAPNGTAQWSAFGSGVVLAGARDSTVRNNLLVNNKSSGVQIVSMIDANFWPSGGNEVRDNVIRGSGRADLLLGGPVEQGSCFAGNDAATSVPFWLNQLHSCEGLNLPLYYGLATSSDPLGRIAQVTWDQNTQLEHGDAPKPTLDFAQLPGGAAAPVVPAVNVFNSLDFDPAAIETPAMPAGMEFDGRRPMFLGVAVDGGFWPVWMGALLWWIPFLTWFAGSIWALWRIWGSGRGKGHKIGWTAGVVLAPVLGLIVYVAVGHLRMRRRRRLIVSLGGTVAWLLAVVGTMLVGGVL
ncbi:MAG TPA: plastocyanin/azurin family copper-binding protein [Acidimicrobiia bacterium]|nr:plastocyanin/azurin family copper-binding protein [Acidimicrobiia bacterium]